MGTHPFRLLILGPTSKITGIHPFRHLYIWPYLKSQNLAPYFLAPVLRFPIGVSYPVGQKLREEINFEETRALWPRAVPWRLTDMGLLSWTNTEHFIKIHLFAP